MVNTSSTHYGEFRVLVTDDQESIPQLIERLVHTRLGCEVRCARSGNEALELLERECFDVFVTDMKMPGIHGFDLIREAKAQWPGMDIIVMTGYPADFPYVDVVNSGANDFINKPFPPSEIEAKLVRLLNERRLRHAHVVAENKYRSLFELNLDGMLLSNYETLAILDSNNSFCELVGMHQGDLLEKTLEEILPDSEFERFRVWLQLCGNIGHGTMGDLHIRHSSGRTIAVDATVTIIRKESDCLFFVAFKDMTTKRELERDLAEAAQSDELTGLMNKRAFQNRLDWAVSTASEKSSALVLMMIDLDNFKRCNDTYGHQIGDRLLASVGSAITASIRRSGYDEGFRYGGDEFCVLLHSVKPGGAMIVAKRMQETFQQLETYGTSMSIGIGAFEPGMTTEELVKRADEALYRAKAAGKNTIEES
ncbi:MAG: diguanylate cyclase [Candidatus Hydrogenedentes bacterium]|nr:diguanylate cyclase [Candidatus Hydrogenedentota bacterium]